MVLFWFFLGIHMCLSVRLFPSFSKKARILAFFFYASFPRPKRKITFYIHQQHHTGQQPLLEYSKRFGLIKHMKEQNGNGSRGEMPENTQKQLG